MQCRDGDVCVKIMGSVELDMARMRKENMRAFPYVEDKKQWAERVNVHFVAHVFLASAATKTIAEITSTLQEKKSFTVDGIPYVWNNQTSLAFETH